MKTHILKVYVNKATKLLLHFNERYFTYLHSKALLPQNLENFRNLFHFNALLARGLEHLLSYQIKCFSGCIGFYMQFVLFYCFFFLPWKTNAKIKYFHKNIELFLLLRKKKAITIGFLRKYLYIWGISIPEKVIIKFLL